MTLKSFNLDDDTLGRITAIKTAKDFKSEKDVLVRAIEHYALSEMIEDESIEFKTFQKLDGIEKEVKRLKSKMNHVDLGVSINNLFLASEFEIKRHPKAIIDRETLEGEYFSSAKKEITKRIRERDNYNRRGQQVNEQSKEIDEDKSEYTERKRTFDIDDDWLNV
ncbi:hypothetical protein [Salinicoccus albus]|uniref:hypothetical protein n=1 Tax=Salinicoccus albus TaxID=418756 RepID=UPI000369577B|nr:hypothetical protein [Salinicoccus albus]